MVSKTSTAVKQIDAFDRLTVQHIAILIGISSGSVYIVLILI